MPEIDQLLDAVEVMTKHRPRKVSTDDGHTWGTEHPLLDELQDAIQSTMQGGRGSRSAAWTRNVLDSKALYLATRITAQIGDWCRMSGIPSTRHPKSDLLAWYAKRLSARQDERAHDFFYIYKLRGWADDIRAMLTPPLAQQQILYPCPYCGADEYVNDHGETVRHPVIVSLYPDPDGGPPSLTNARGICQACNLEWVGDLAIRALSFDLENPPLTTETEGQT